MAKFCRATSQRKEPAKRPAPMSAEANTTIQIGTAATEASESARSTRLATHASNARLTSACAAAMR